jgi:threonyl-tRNA synthetase
MKNTNGKEDTAFTVQYDFVMPKRFELRYVNEIHTKIASRVDEAPICE